MTIEPRRTFTIDVTKPSQALVHQSTIPLQTFPTNPGLPPPRKRHTGARVLLRDGDGAWQDVRCSIDDLLSDAVTAKQRFIFVDWDNFKNNEVLRLRFYSHFGMPAALWGERFRRSNGGFGAEDEYDSQGVLNLHKSWFIFIMKHIGNQYKLHGGYIWDEMTFFTRWTASSNTLICFDTPSSLQDGLLDRLPTDPPRAADHDIYALHTFLIDGILDLYDASVWSIRDAIRNSEKARDQDSLTEVSFPYLHEVARHSIHSTETLGVAFDTMSNMAAQHAQLAPLQTPSPTAPLPTPAAAPALHPPPSLTPASFLRTRQRLAYHLQTLGALRARSTSNSSRLQNELTLAFNLVAQRDARASVSLGISAASDNAAMRTIAFATLMFLPATFVSAIFGTQFFNFSPPANDAGDWVVSDKLWIYFAVAVPLTVVTMIAWALFQRRFPSKSGLGY